MRPSRTAARMPDGFRELRAGPMRVWVDPPFADAATALGLLEVDGVARLLAAGAGRPGRGPTAVAALPGRPERLHLRPVRHGGWLGSWRGDRLLGLWRPAAELRASLHLAAAGVPVARPALLVGRRRRGPLWSAALGTVHEEHTHDGVEFLASRPSPERLLRAAEAAADAVRRLHDAGGRHADLHLGNLLVRELGGHVEVLIVDLDRARVRPLGARVRMAQLMRLYRSLVKRGFADRTGLRAAARFLACYTQGERRLRRALLAHLPRERLRLRVHALGWGRS